MNQRLSVLGEHLASARKYYYPQDTQKIFAVRIGVSKATYSKMEKGDLSVGLDKYYAAAQLLGLEAGFEQLFTMQRSLLDD
ncbi:helix-turn-helix domain-containing protein [Nitrincola sp. A-D6]|uniref:helix-turn-helix domain-containing protein n=1 Tax=Nitrincola sp. A-D6 TaxID=1545442 RepID=UPI00118674A0|nr:helix-turn-helix transcriptional regulator [Nitrincola sp. A-D6]